MKTITYITIILIFITLFSCKDKSSRTDDDTIYITITETINGDEIIYQLIKIDSICAKHYNQTVPEEPSAQTQDANVSLLEKLGGKEIKKEDENEKAMEKAKKEHPFFCTLMPNLEKSGAATPSSFIGTSFNKDTSVVIDMLKSANVLDKDIQTKWVTGWTPELSFLVLFKSKARKEKIDNSSIDKIEFEKTESFNNNDAIRIGAGLLGQLEYYLTIFPRQSVSVTSLPNQNKNYLFEIELHNKKYYASQPLESFYKGLFIKTSIMQNEIDSLKIHYPISCIEKRD